MQIPLLKGDKADNNVDYRDALPVNYYAVLRDINNAKGYFLNFYGLTSVGNGAGKSRGSIYVNREDFKGHYRVSGHSLIFIDDGGEVSDLGTIYGTGQASLTYSLNNLAIVSDGLLYYYNKTDGLRQITDSDVGDIIDIVWADFRFVATDGEYLYQSSALDEEVFESADFSGSDFQPDKIWGVGLNEDNELVAFNSFTTEYFYNAGADNFAYVRIPAKAIKSGILGTHCKIEYKDQWFSLTRRTNTQPQFSVIQSGSSESITTREIEKVLRQYTDSELSLTTLDIFVKDSVVWFIAHLPNETLAFNYTLSLVFGIEYSWSILKSDTIGDKTFRAKDFIYDPDMSEWVGGDKNTDDLCFLDDSVCTQYDDVVEGLLYTPIIPLESLSIDEIEIETIPGIAPNKDATVFISRSDDLRVDGNEWTALYGDNLDYNQRFIVRRVGYVRDNVSFRIRTASRSRMSFCNFNLEAS